MDDDSLERICREAAGLVDSDGYYDPRDASSRLVDRTVLALHMAKPVWDKPGGIKSEVEGIREDIRALVLRIERLDNYARWLARTADRYEELGRIEQDLVEAGQSGDQERHATAMAALKRHVNHRTPHEEWLDYALIRQLLKFEAALRVPEERASGRPPTGRGQPRNEWAYRVALIAARFFQEATGSRPTFWTDGETPFSRFVSSLYREMGIEADLRRPIEWAMSELKKKR